MIVIKIDSNAMLGCFECFFGLFCPKHTYKPHPISHTVLKKCRQLRNKSYYLKFGRDGFFNRKKNTEASE